MNIVLEGFDGSGKSTLAEVLAKEFQLEYFWASGPAKNHAGAIDCCEEQIKLKNCVIDRVTCISAWAYMNRYISVQLVMRFIQYQKEMENKGFLFVYCTTEGQFTADKEFDNGDYCKWLIKNAWQIRHRYDQIFKHIPHFKFDYTEQSYDEVIAWINSQKKTRKLS